MLSNENCLPKGQGNKIYSMCAWFFSAVMCQRFEFIADPSCKKCNCHAAYCQENCHYDYC